MRPELQILRLFMRNRPQAPGFREYTIFSREFTARTRQQILEKLAVRLRARTFFGKD